MALTLSETELFDFAVGSLPQWVRTQDEFLTAAAKMFGLVRTQIDYLFGQALITTATGATSTTPDWLQQHARDRATSRQAGETDPVLQQRLRVVPDALTRQAVLDAANAILAAAGVVGSAAMLELPRDGAWLGHYTAMTGTGGTFVQVGPSSKFTPTTLPWPTPPFQAASVSPVRQHRLRISTPGSAFPASAGAMATAVGGGTWTAGYLCEDASAKLAASFGGTDLPESASGGSPSYQIAGPLGDKAVKISVANSGFECASGAFLDVGANDLVGAMIVRTDSTLSVDTYLCSKIDFVGGTGFTLQTSPNGSVTFAITPGISTVTAAGALAPNDWSLIMWTLDRGAAKAAVAVQSLTTGTLTVSQLVSTSLLGSIANASPFRVNRGGTLGGPFDVAALWVGAGVGAAGGISGAISTRIRSLAAALGIGNDGARIITGLDGNAVIVVNSTGIAGAAPTVTWTVERMDGLGNVTDGFARSYCGRGWRMSTSRPLKILVILPFGTSAGTQASVEESIRTKKAAGVALLVERRQIP